MKSPDSFEGGRYYDVIQDYLNSYVTGVANIFYAKGFQEGIAYVIDSASGVFGGTDIENTQLNLELISGSAFAIEDNIWLEATSPTERISDFEGLIQSLEAEIELSKQILDYKDDWDGEGSPAYSMETWQRAVDFLKYYIQAAWQKLRIVLSIPKILPGPDGSIDLHWKTDIYELLVNIPPKDTNFAGFYGDTTSGDLIKGKISLQKKELRLGLIEWLDNQM
jgi:hypothetical protein